MTKPCPNELRVSQINAEVSGTLRKRCPESWVELSEGAGYFASHLAEKMSLGSKPNLASLIDEFKRVSFGAQIFSEDNIGWLSRRLEPHAFYQCLTELREVGKLGEIFLMGMEDLNDLLAPTKSNDPRIVCDRKIGIRNSILDRTAYQIDVLYAHDYHQPSWEAMLAFLKRENGGRALPEGLKDAAYNVLVPRDGYPAPSPRTQEAMQDWCTKIAYSRITLKL